MRRSAVALQDPQDPQHQHQQQLQQQQLQQQQDYLQYNNSTANLSRDSYDDEMPKPGITGVCKSYCQRNPKITILVGLLLVTVVAAILTVALVLSRDKNPNEVSPPQQEETSAERIAFLQNFVLPLSGQEAFEKPGSPQQRALDWLTHDDPAKIPLNQELRLLQRYILAVLYFSTGGASWADSLFFLSGDNECRWNRWNVKQELLDGVTCDGDKIIFIRLGKNSLAGTIPTELQELKQLSRLSLYTNRLQGTIPPQVTNITTLEVMELYFNTLQGSIPNDIGKLSQLEILDLSSNTLTGTMPASMASLTKMTDLWLFSNRLTGSVPLFLQNWTNLDVIKLYDNSIRGDINFLCDANMSIISVDCNEISCTCDCACF